MAIVVSYDEAILSRKQRIRDDGNWTARVDYLVSPPDAPERPQAFISEQGPGRHLPTHFHYTDQFQVFIRGGGTNGHHPISPYQVHFARKHTPYGPLNADQETGCWFFTLRPRRDPGAQYLSENREKLESIPNRMPWQISADVRFPADSIAASSAQIEGVDDERGLAGTAISLRSNASTLAPSAQNSDGQYIVVLEGSIVYGGKEFDSKTLVYVAPGEAPFELVSGAKGMQAVALNFPRAASCSANPPAQRNPAAQEAGDEADREFNVWACVLCSFVYDEAEGLPSEGIAPGTRWEDVPEEWCCPDCSAKKSDFEMVKI